MNVKGLKIKLKGVLEVWLARKESFSKIIWSWKHSTKILHRPKSKLILVKISDWISYFDFFDHIQRPTCTSQPFGGHSAVWPDGLEKSPNFHKSLPKMKPNVISTVIIIRGLFTSFYCTGSHFFSKLTKLFRSGTGLLEIIFWG